jgi:hypothetical protein
VFDFVRAHLPVLDGGAAVGKGSSVLSKEFLSNRICLSDSQSSVTQVAVSLVLRIACTCWSQLNKECCQLRVRSAGPGVHIKCALSVFVGNIGCLSGTRF